MAAFASSGSTCSAADCINDIQQSLNDKRQYRWVRLANQLAVLLVCDADTDRAAASLDVHVGSTSDPKPLPGLAHFLEHMLFLGTEKYPDEDEFGEFLNKHNGSTNAYTGDINTNYHFDVSAKYFRPALDRFAQFFIAPLFTVGATDREVLAVDSEFQKGLHKDHWRNQELLKVFINAEHPFSHFGFGNKHTLKDVPEQQQTDVRQYLLDFHATYYSASIMRLVLLGREPLDVLQSWATELFSSIRNLGISPPSLSLDIDKVLRRTQVLVNVVPIKDVRGLTARFPIPVQTPRYRSKPHYYAAHLLEHEGPGSLVAVLKKREWAYSVEAFVDTGVGDFDFLVCNFALTEAGDQKILELLALFFTYVEFLAHQPVQRWLFEELKTLKASFFAFHPSVNPLDAVTGLAADMHEYPPSEILVAPHLLFDFIPAEIEQFWPLLTPQRAIFFHLSKRHQTLPNLDTELWYGTKYNVEPLTELPLVVDPPAFSMPAQNPFICREFSIKNPPLSEELALVINGVDDDDESEEEDDSDAEEEDEEEEQEEEEEEEEENADESGATDGHGDDDAEEELVVTAGNSSSALESNNETESPGNNDDEVDGAQQLETAVQTRREVLWSKHARKIERALAQARLVPQRLLNTEQVRLWFKADQLYRLPHCRCYFKFYLPYLCATPTDAVSLYLVNDSVVFLLNESLMDAHLAGLKYNFVTSDGGSLRFTFSGYNEKLPLLVQRVCDAVFNLEIPESIFHLSKEEALRDLRNREQDSPYSMVSYLLDVCVMEPNWTVEDKLVALEKVTYQRFLERRKNVWSKFSLEAFVAGNLLQEDAETLSQLVLDIAGVDRALPAEPCDFNSRRCILLPAGTRHSFEKEYANPENSNSAILAWWQLGEETTELRMTAYVIEQLIADIVYDFLRTKEQLGYLVSSEERTFGTSIGLQVTVQSADYTPQYLSERIHACMKEAYDKIKAMSKREFEANIESLLLLKVEKFVTLKQDTVSIWGEITSRHYHFLRLQTELDALRSPDLSQAAVLRFFEDRIFLDGANLRLLEISVWSARHRQQQQENPATVQQQPPIVLIENIRAFKRRSQLCPAFLSPVQSEFSWG